MNFHVEIKAFLKCIVEEVKNGSIDLKNLCTKLKMFSN